MAQLLLVRHGETSWSGAGRHTGRTDVPLTTRGEAQARALAPLLAAQPIVAVLCSPLTRARRTAVLAGLSSPLIEPGLQEWDYGGYEGMTAAEIHQSAPGWNLWRDGVPAGDPGHPGETVGDVGARADATLARVRALLAKPDLTGESAIALVGHGHALRVLAARWLGLAPEQGALFRLDTATVSRLGHEHGRRVIRGWNFSPAAPAG